ncbi:MAG TPA: carbon-nitrogen hydrolase family protein, partial [Nocardioides sp.]
VLPEAFLTGYATSAFAAPLPTPADLAGPLLDPLRESARAGGVVALVGTPVARGHLATLSLAMVATDGAVTVPYDKQHLDGDEKDRFVVGHHGASVRIGDAVGAVELGLSICYDGCFGEHAAAAARDGAVGYLASAAYFAGSEHRRDLYYAARALENGLYVAFAGLTGRCGGRDFSGGSALYDPEGRVLARLGTEEGVVVSDLDLDLVASTRRTHTMLADHRPSLGPRRRV